jgi:hypothetical protein
MIGNIYFILAGICFIVVYIGFKLTHRKTEQSREPVLGLAIVLGLFGPMALVFGVIYVLYAFIAYQVNSRK